MPRIRMHWKEVAEGRRAGIPEPIIGKIEMGMELTEKEKEIINKLGKVYVEGHKRDGKWVKPQLRDLPKGSKGKLTPEELTRRHYKKIGDMYDEINRKWKEIGDLPEEIDDVIEGGDDNITGTLAEEFASEKAGEMGLYKLQDKLDKIVDIRKELWELEFGR